jgi:hypothetical protein
MNENQKAVEVKYKVDAKFIADLCDLAQTKEGEEKKEILEQIKFFSNHLGKYLVQDVKE